MAIFERKMPKNVAKSRVFEDFTVEKTEFILRDTVEGFFNEIEIKVRCKLKRDFFK
ncbi:hypothetical protein F120042H4_20310 [Faecalimonas umbilicata]